MRISKNYILILVAAVLIPALGFTSPDLLEWMKQSEEKLMSSYSADLAHAKAKKVDIQLTKDGFFRYRRTLLSGKQEYFAFNFSQFEELDFLGTSEAGFLVLRAKPESIIVQTFHDAKGNVDSMATELQLPTKNLQVDDLQSLQACFLRIKEKLNQP